MAAEEEVKSHFCLIKNHLWLTGGVGHQRGVGGCARYGGHQQRGEEQRKDATTTNTKRKDAAQVSRVSLPGDQVSGIGQSFKVFKDLKVSLTYILRMVL